MGKVWYKGVIGVSGLVSSRIKDKEPVPQSGIKG